MERKHYILALGSNKGDKKAQVEAAILAVGESIGLVVSQSSLYETAPYGGVADESFVNAAVVVKSDLEPAKVLEKLLEIEALMGRVRDVKWGNREIDLDIIFVIEKGQFVNISTDSLIIPHPEALKRDFVMAPVLEAMAKLYPLKAMD